MKNVIKCLSLIVMGLLFIVCISPNVSASYPDIYCNRLYFITNENSGWNMTNINNNISSTPFNDTYINSIDYMETYTFISTALKTYSKLATPTYIESTGLVQSVWSNLRSYIDVLYPNGNIEEYSDEYCNYYKTVDLVNGGSIVTMKWNVDTRESNREFHIPLNMNGTYQITVRSVFSDAENYTVTTDSSIFTFIVGDGEYTPNNNTGNNLNNPVIPLNYMDLGVNLFYFFMWSALICGPGIVAQNYGMGGKISYIIMIFATTILFILGYLPYWLWLMFLIIDILVIILPDEGD